MKVKFILLFMMLILLSGCDAVYRVEYVDDIFKESLSINNLSGYEEQVRSVYNFDLSTNYEDVSDYSKEEGLSNGYTYYEKSLNDVNNLTLRYSYNFSKDKYDHSYIGRYVYPNLHFNENTLYSGGINDIYIKYPALNNITIEFITDKYVSYNNADRVSDNVYYWYLTKENYDTKKVEIVFSQDDPRDIVEVIQDKADEIKEQGKSKSYLGFVFIGIGVILLFGFIFVFVKVKNSNKK